MSFFRNQFLQSAHATLYSATGDTDPSVLSAPVTPISLTRQTQLTNRTELSFLVMGTIEQPSWVETRSYQQQAIRRWLDAEAQGILHMATGTGKTVTSLLAATRLAETAGDRLLLVIAVPYQHLVDQWAADVRDFGVQPRVSVSVSEPVAASTRARAPRVQSRCSRRRRRRHDAQNPRECPNTAHTRACHRPESVAHR